MRKLFSTLITALLIVGCLSACGSETGQAKQNDKEPGKLKVVTTIFPEYDWVKNILGDKFDNADVSMLLDSGVDLHSYQPTADDIMKISMCDVFIYTGGESDEWVEDALREATNKDMVVINLLKALGDSAKKEEVIEGMQGEDHDHAEGEEHEHAEGETASGEEHDHEHEHGEGEPEYDEHVWLSLRNASALTDAIKEGLAKADPANAEVYKANAEAYKERLRALDGEYESVVSAAPVKTLVFGDRFPFRYLTDDYGLSYYAAFVGCSAETEASFETVTFLANKVDELSLHSVMTIEGKDHKIAETIVQNTKTKDQKILTLDSMQSTTAKAVENGADYISIMKSNLDVLKEALK